VNLTAILAVAGGGALGSVARYLLAIYAGRWLGAAFPWGTLFINVTGSFLIGAFAEAMALRWHTGMALRVFLVVGICGGYTTFSTFSLDFVTLANRGEMVSAMSYAAASIVLSILALYLAMYIMRATLV
jgi:fluoride exporter